jgi:acyl-CoA synthetase (AMP-forming)/AMP-acid ligase II
MWSSFLLRLKENRSFAVIDSNRCFTSSDILSMSDVLERDLQQIGVRGIICVSILNSVQLVSVLLTLMRMEVSLVLLPTKAPVSTVCSMAALLKPQCYIVDASQAACLQQAISPAKCVMLNSSASLGMPIYIFTTSYGNSHPNTEGDTHGGSVFKLTSGTSGNPKVVSLSACQLEAEALNISHALSLTERDIILAPVSILHSYGFDLGLIASLWAGCTLVLKRSFSCAVLEDLSSLHATILLGIPSMYRAFASRWKGNAPELTAMRFLLSCTGSLCPEMILRFYEQFGTMICQHYGTSETGALANHSPAEVIKKLASVGKSLEGVELRLLDSEGHEVPNGPGYIFARGKAVAKGYVGLQNCSAPKRKFFDGGFLTDDVGVVDRDGFLFLHLTEKAASTTRTRNRKYRLLR